jgi:GDPmannose 4,6-dehydratase
VWEGEGADEIGRDAESGQIIVRIDPRYFRPTEVDLLLGDPTKAREVLGWRHTSSFEDLVKEMMTYDLQQIDKEQSRKDRGHH